MKNQSIFLLRIAIVLALISSCKTDNTIPQDLNTDQKEASSYTIEKQEAIKTYLDFQNTEDFDSANKNLLGTIDSGQIINDTSNKVIYDMKQYNFITGEAPNETNPSLWRQSKLNKINGLFEVVKDSIYQIRGFDLANMTLIRGASGWIIVDPLGSPETAEAGLNLANEKLKFFSNEKTVSNIIFTHSHIDHFGGIQGVLKHAKLNVPIYAPKGFFEEAISENVMGGNTMGRRASYMYGNILKKDTLGTLGTGLGQTTSTGTPGIKDGTIIIDENTLKNKFIDKIRVQFIYTPEAEAPAEFMFYLPSMKAFCQAEEINHTLHNLYTLRGAKVRNGQKWSQYIDKVIQNWGDEVKVSFGSHHWPTWGNHKVNSLWENQRDLYRFIHDQTLRLANHGETPIEIAEQLKLPESLDKVFANRGYYGTLSHNARAQYQLYFGWFDGNPANLNKMTPAESGKKYLKYVGEEVLFDAAKKAFDKGEYRWAAEVLNTLVFANANNENAKYLLADTYEQLGYQAESGPWRNFYLSGAKELRSETAPGEGIETVNTASPDMISGMSNELLFNYLAMCFNGMDADAEKMKYNFQISFMNSENTAIEESVALIVQNGVLTPRIDYIFKGSEVTQEIKMTRETLNSIILKELTFKKAIRKGYIKIITNENADPNSFTSFLSKLDSFDFWFNIVKP